MKIISTLFSIVICLSIANAQNGLVGYWSFDKFSSEFFKDDLPSNNNGTTYEVFGAPGIQGKALDFNGSNAYAAIRGAGLGDKPPIELSNLGVGSISIWFNVRDIPLEHGIAPIFYYGSKKKCDFFDAANNGLIIEVGHSPIYPENEALFFTIWKDGCTYPSCCFDSNNKIEKNKWYHFVAVVGEDFNTGYLNGEELTSRSYNFGNESYSQFFRDAVKHEEFWLGKGYWDRTTQYFDGKIDELRIYNRPLNLSEVKQLYDNHSILTSNSNVGASFEFSLLYPNPASEKVYINTSGLGFKIEKVRFTKVDGKQYEIKTQFSSQNELAIPNIPDGLYLVRLIGKEGSKTIKLLVRK